MTLGTLVRTLLPVDQPRGELAMQRHDSAMAGSDTTTTTPQPSTGRTIAFRVVAILVSLWLLAMNVFGLMEVVLMWLPAETLASMLDESASELSIHRAHFMAIGILSWAAVLSMLVQLRKPERRVAPMLLLVAIALGAAVVYGLSGTLNAWLIEEIAFLVAPVALVVLLHPSRAELLAKPSFRRPLAGAATLASVPWMVFIVENARSQFTNAAGDSHAAVEHWATAALMGVVIVAAAFLGSSDHSGWRLTGGLAVGGSVVFGVHSLVYAGLASALPAVWAVAAILWGIAFGAMLVRRARADATPTAVA